MSSWKWRQVETVLLKKGFQLERITNHAYYRFYVGGRATSIRTKVSHADKKPLHADSPLMRMVQRQLHLQRKELEDFLNCPLSEEDYHQHLVDQGVLRE